MKRLFTWLIVILLVVGLVLVGYAFYSPRLLIPKVQEAVLALTHHPMEIKGGASLKLRPSLAVSFKNVVIIDPADNNRPFLRAEKMIVPITFKSLFSKDVELDQVTLVNPSFDVVIPQRTDLSSASVVQDEATTQADSSQTQKIKDLTIKVEGGAFNYIDERNGQTITINDISTKLQVRNGDELESNGTISFEGQTAHLDAHVTSLKRIARDGSPADITLKAPTIDASFSGRLTTRDRLGLAGMFQASSTDFKKFASWVNLPIRKLGGMKDFSLTAAVDVMGKAVKFKQADVVLDDLVATGELGLDFTQKRPRLDAVLKTNMFTLDPYIDGTLVRTDDLSGFTVNSKDWSSVDFDFSALKAINTNITLSTQKFKWGKHEISPMDLSLVLEDGHLMLTVPNSPIYGGNIAMTLDLDAAQPKPVLDLNVTGANVQAQEIFSDFTGRSWLQGPANLRLVMNATGTSPQEMISTIRGKFMVAVGQGAFIGLDVPKLMAKLRDSAATGWADSAGKVSPFTSAVANFDLRDGIASTSDLTITAPDYNITGKGDIDLLRQAVNMHFIPVVLVPGQAPTGLTLPVAVFGRWEEPKIFPDSPEVPVSPAANSIRAVEPPPLLNNAPPPAASSAPGKGNK